MGSSLRINMALFYLVWAVAALILMSVGVSVGSWQKPSQNRLMVFRSPMVGRAGVISLSIWVFFSPLLFAALGAYAPFSFAPVGKLTYSALILCYFGMACVLAAVLVRVTPPQQTTIDLEQRVCLHMRGSGRQRREWNIPLDDISAVCVSHRNSVYLKSTQQESWSFRLTLGHFAMNGFSPMRPKALHFAQEVAETLALPVREVAAGEA